VCACERPVAVTEGGWYPRSLSVTFFARERKLLCLVIRVGSIVVIICVTARACIGCIVVITVVTGGTVVGYGRMCSD
jgi:hypothetical protein